MTHFIVLLGQGVTKLETLNVYAIQELIPGRPVSSDSLIKVAKNVALNPRCLSIKNFFDWKLCPLVTFQMFDLQEFTILYL